MKALIFAAAVIATAVAPAAAQSPVAIVEDVKGKVDGVEFMDYVAPGKVIKLGATGMVVLGYLDSCLRETIKGGVAIVGPEESRTSLAEVSREKVGCDSGRAQLATRETSLSAATTFRTLEPKAPSPVVAKAEERVIFGVSPVIELRQPGKLVIERIDAPGERIEATTTAKSLVKGRFYDLAAAGKSLMPGGTYAATSGSQRTLFRVDSLARPGASPIIGRLVRL
jgi:hypothetical protein